MLESPDAHVHRKSSSVSIPKGWNLQEGYCTVLKKKRNFPPRNRQNNFHLSMWDKSFLHQCIIHCQKKNFGSLSQGKKFCFGAESFFFFEHCISYTTRGSAIWYIHWDQPFSNIWFSLKSQARSSVSPLTLLKGHAGGLGWLWICATLKQGFELIMHSLFPPRISMEDWTQV